MYAVYKKCPVLESSNYRLRLVELEDASDLLKVYSDERAVPLFNSDNCHGDNFYYTTKDQMKRAIKFWLKEYAGCGFVRWTVIDKNSRIAIGTIEIFHRDAADYFDACGLLRLDLRSDYEVKQDIQEILSMILPSVYEWFDCDFVASKAVSSAVERIKALKELGFSKTEEKLIGHDGQEYDNYWICKK